jgi:hypothetical protein
MEKMMPIVETPAFLASLAVVAILSLGWIAVDARQFRARQKEAQLKAAAEFLEAHIGALEKLDDEAMPSALLALALQLSRLCQSERAAKAVEVALAEDSNAFEIDLEATPDSGLHEVFSSLSRRRPDLASAFGVACASAMAYFSTMWPRCAPAFQAVMIEMAGSPVEETERVVRASDQMARRRKISLEPAMAA